MNLIELTIGREAESGKLCIAVGGKKVLAGDADSVPKSVSREHLRHTVSEEGHITVENINIENDLYVNGFGVERKRVGHGDRIELGRDRYQLEWDVLDRFFCLADISPLQQVWTDYQAERLRLQIRERRFGVLRSATGILTTAAMILGFMELGGNGNTLRLLLYGSSFAVTLLFFIIAWRAASRVPLQQQAAEERARKAYRCPSCHCLFNLQNFDLLRQMKKCPHCGAFFVATTEG
ncbi:MAG: FHA domain-containing protein [Bacteroidaceae bacterium]|nr:FHA domain-containing protein [Bacteroidaceae bacterium]